MHLAGWLNGIEALWNSRRDYTISHIEKDKNKKVDALSKMGISSPQVVWRMQIMMDNFTYQIQEFCLPGT